MPRRTALICNFTSEAQQQYVGCELQLLDQPDGLHCRRQQQRDTRRSFWLHQLPLEHQLHSLPLPRWIGGQCAFTSLSTVVLLPGTRLTASATTGLLEHQCAYLFNLCAVTHYAIQTSL